MENDEKLHARKSLLEPEIADCLCSMAREAAVALTDLYNLVLSPARLKVTQFMLLGAIGKASAVSQHELVKQLSLAPETISRRISAMRTAEWIEAKGGHRGREHFYALTQKGRARFEEALPYWTRSQNRIRACLGDERWAAIFPVLKALSMAARRAETARLSNAPLRKTGLQSDRMVVGSKSLAAKACTKV